MTEIRGEAHFVCDTGGNTVNRPVEQVMTQLTRARIRPLYRVRSDRGRRPLDHHGVGLMSTTDDAFDGLTEREVRARLERELDELRGDGARECVLQDVLFELANETAAARWD